VFLVPELPLAGTNKIDRAALKARALAGQSQQASRGE
jgi:hypothetical protein